MTHPRTPHDPAGRSDLRPVTPRTWHAAARALRDDGWHFCGLYVAPAPGLPALRMVLRRRTDTLLLSTHTDERETPTVTDVFPAAVWDEREAHDTYDWSFTGHVPLRPLVDHDTPEDAWITPVDGEDAYQLAVGPIHAGVIESGHFRLHVVGERILHLDLRLFYNHRGLQAAAEHHSVDEGLEFVHRACAADAISSTLAYAQACEAARGLWPSRELARVRTILVELERLYNHLNDIAALCAGVGFSAGNMLFATLKERAQRLNALLTGHRFLFHSLLVGHSDQHWDAGLVQEAREALVDLHRDVDTAWHEIAFARSFQERLGGVGVLTHQQARELGVSGPIARASGIREDTRSSSPRLSYPTFVPALIDDPSGDVDARLRQRGVEITGTFSLLDALLTRPVTPSTCSPVASHVRVGVGLVEGARGQTTCVVEVDQDRLSRVHLRTASYANWPALTYAVRGELLPDFPLINKSFELCYACVDR